MQFVFSEPLHYHDKEFTLSWAIPQASKVLVHFNNGKSKPWYVSAKHSNLFKRWFVRKGTDTFTSVANVNSPHIVLYVFRNIFSLPIKVVVPMRVQLLRVDEPEISTQSPGISLIDRKAIVINNKIDLPENELTPGFLLCRNFFFKVPALKNTSILLQNDFKNFKH